MPRPKPAKPTRAKKVVVKKSREEIKPSAKPIASYDHKLAERVNNPPVGLAHADNDPDLAVGRKQYAYDPHLDPQLVWAGKAEHTSFEVPTVSLHVHERIDPRTIVEAVLRESKTTDRDVGGFLVSSVFVCDCHSAMYPRSRRLRLG